MTCMAECSKAWAVLVHCSDLSRGEDSWRCDTQHSGEDRRQTPEACVSAGSATPSLAPNEPYPKLVHPDKAFVWSHGSSECNRTHSASPTAGGGLHAR